MPSHLENPFRPPIPTVVDHEKEAHAIGLLLGPKAEAAYRKRHAHDLSDPSVSVSVGLTAEEQAQMNEKPQSLLTPERRERIKAAWGKFLTESGLNNADDLLDSMEIHEDGSVSLEGGMDLGRFMERPPIFPTKIRELHGNLWLGGLITAEHLVLPASMIGELILDNLTSAKYLVLPVTMNGDLYLAGLVSAEYLVLPSVVSGFLDISGLKSAEHLVLPKTVGGWIYFDKDYMRRSELDKIRASRPDLEAAIVYK